MLERTIFEGEDIKLRLVEPRPRSLDRIVVTFQARNPQQTLHRPGFAEEFLAKYGIPALHVTASRNHWYQVREMATAMRRAARIGQAYGRLTTYGSSMGAHAAVVFSAALNAQAVIALSPLYSIDPRIVPHDRRYAADARDMRFRYKADEGARRDARAYLFHDPRSLDGWHARRIAACFDRPAVVALPFAGHPCGTLLAETGLLSATIRGLVAGAAFDAPALRSAVRASRAGSPSYWGGMARALRARSPEQAVCAARRAAALDPRSTVHAAGLGDALSLAGHHDDAIERLAAVTRAEPRKARFHASLAQAWARAGNPAAAIAAIAPALRLAPQDPSYARLHAAWQARLELI